MSEDTTGSIDKNLSRLTEPAAMIWAAIFGLLGVAIGALITGGVDVYTTNRNHQAQLDLEVQRVENVRLQAERELESSIVLRIIETDSITTAKNNLLFVVDAGFISDPEGKIHKAIEEDTVPILSQPPVETSIVSYSVVRIEGVVLDARTDVPLEDAMVVLRVIEFGSDSSMYQRAFTDSQGFFVLRIAESDIVGEFVVIQLGVSAAGYEAQLTSWDHYRDIPRPLLFRLESNGE